VAVLGVDGWRGAWVAARLDGGSVTLSVLPDAAAVLAVRDVEVMGIDMPIGLSEDGARACDVEARRLLGPAHSSVFPAPVRPVLATHSYADACVASIRALEPVMDVLDALARAGPRFPVVDALDACAAAWSAQRIADGTAKSVGDDTRDARGRPMRICW
jgi:predicted RNase H-like nuclease